MTATAPAAATTRVAAPVAVFRPLPARVIAREETLPDHLLLRLRLDDAAAAAAWRHRPGQFLLLSVPGTGEIPLSVAAPPDAGPEVCVRRVGRVTGALFRLPPGAPVGLRGPFGNGFPLEELGGHDLLLVGSALGLAPLRSLLGHVRAHRADFGQVILCAHAPSPSRLPFLAELAPLAAAADVRLLVGVDEDPAGRLPAAPLSLLIRQAAVTAPRTFACLAAPWPALGPGLHELQRLGLRWERILVSLERRMHCGLGTCGQCAVGSHRACVEGPVLHAWDLLELPELRLP